MQKIRSILKIGTSGAALCDAYGSTNGVVLELMSGTSYILEFDLRSESAGESAVLPAYPAATLQTAGCYCALDENSANSDDPPMLICSGVTLTVDKDGYCILSVPFNGNAGSKLAGLLTGQSSVDLLCELGGFDSDGTAVFAWQFPVTLRSRVYRGSGSESVPDDPAYLTAVQVQAIASGLEGQIRELSDKITAVPEISTDKLAVSDTGNYFDGDSVEDVLQEIGAELDGLEHILEGI